jgi:hypothetical protein
MLRAGIAGALLVAQAACADQAALVVRLDRLSGVPAAGGEITVLPVSPDALLDSLASASLVPRPTFPDLEAAMRSFRQRDGVPDSAGAQSATAAWQAVRDSLEALGATLRSMDRASLAYREAYERLRGLYDRLGQRAAARDRALQGGLAPERELARRAERAADSLRRWEQAAYADFPARLADAVRRSGRDVQQRTTDSTGAVRFAVPPGRWWIQARMRDPDNPFLERYWAVPVTVTRLVPVAVPLGAATGQVRWRH